MPPMPIPGLTLMHQVKIAFYQQHSSLAAWCRGHGVTRQYASQSLLGRRHGSEAKAMCRRLWQAAHTQGEAMNMQREAAENAGG